MTSNRDDVPRAGADKTVTLHSGRKPKMKECAMTDARGNVNWEHTKDFSIKKEYGK